MFRQENFGLIFRSVSKPWENKQVDVTIHDPKAGTSTSPGPEKGSKIRRLDSTYQKVVQGKWPLMSLLLEHSFLEHFCLDQSSVIQCKFCMQRFSNTSFGRTLLGSNFGGPLTRANFLSALSGLPKECFCRTDFGLVFFSLVNLSAT